MKIATFNINDVNKRLGALLGWLESTRPDVVCLQELKAAQRDFPANALAQAGYQAVWRGQRTWNGVAILARGAEPILTRDALPGDAEDAQSRYIEAAVRGVLIASLYLPNGNPHPGPKFKYKLAWFERLLAHADELWRSGAPVVLAGDYNVAPGALDAVPSRSYASNALLAPESRAAYARLLAQGWRDAIRDRHPATPMYTFWDYQRDRFARDAGLRARPSAAERARRQAAQGRRRRSLRARGAWRQRSRAGVDRAALGANGEAGDRPRPLHPRQRTDAASRSTVISRGQNRNVAHRSTNAFASLAFFSATKPSSSSSGTRDCVNNALASSQ